MAWVFFYHYNDIIRPQQKDDILQMDRWHFKCIFFNSFLIGISVKASLNDMIRNSSTSLHMVVWWCNATRHYLNQIWRRSMMPYGENKPQYVRLHCCHNNLKVHNCSTHPWVLLSVYLIYGLLYTSCDHIQLKLVLCRKNTIFPNVKT